MYLLSFFLFFLRQGIHCRLLGKGRELEYIVIEVLTGGGKFKVVKRLSVEVLREVMSWLDEKVI